MDENNQKDILAFYTKTKVKNISSIILGKLVLLIQQNNFWNMILSWMSRGTEDDK